MLSNSTQEKDGHSASDSDSGELLAMGSQCDGGGPLQAGASAGPATDTYASPVARQRIHTQARTGRHRVVVRCDGRPRRPLQQPANQCTLNATSSSCPATIAAHTANSVADIKELASLQTDGDQTHFYQYYNFSVFCFISFRNYNFVVRLSSALNRSHLTSDLVSMNCKSLHYRF